MGTRHTPISRRTRLGAAALDLGLAVGAALLLTFALGYSRERYISYDGSQISTGTVTHYGFSFTLFVVLSVVFWFALALVASRDAYDRTPGQRNAGYRPRATSGAARLDIPRLLKRQALRVAAAPSALAAFSQGQELAPTHDATSETRVEWCPREAKHPGASTGPGQATESPTGAEEKVMTEPPAAGAEERR